MMVTYGEWQAMLATGEPLTRIGFGEYMRNAAIYGAQTLAQKIKAMFANGEQGVWYDPSDLSTMYQDSAGTTAVTAVEQPVGLHLDKRFGVALGSELVTNGAFDVDTAGWEGIVSTLAVVGGKLQVTSSGAGCYARQVLATVVGATYRITGTMRAPSANTTVNAARIRVYDNTALTTDLGSLYVTSEDVDQAFSFVFRATTTTSTIQAGVASLAAWGAVGDTALFDNISVKQIGTGIGNHRSQATAASRPLLSARMNPLIYTEDFTNAAWSKAGTTVTANAAVAPDGTITADLLVDDAANSEHLAEQTWAVNTNGQYTQSIYVKNPPAATFHLMVVHVGLAPTTSYASFAVSAGGITTSGFVGIITGSTATAVGNGWYRVTATYTLSGTVTSHRLRLYTKNSGAYLGDGVSNITTWGAQIDVGSVATRYQRIGPQRNLLTKTEDLSVSEWTKASVTISGTDTITSAGGAGPAIYNTTGITVVPTQVVTVAMDVMLGTMEASEYKLAFYNATALAFIAQDVAPSITLNGVDWQRTVHSITIPAGCTQLRIYPFRNNAGVGGTVRVRNLQLELGSVATAYERVDTAANTYDTAGFPHYLKYDGVDDWMSTASIDFTATDKMTVVAGVNIAARDGMIAELSTGTATGSFYVYSGTVGPEISIKGISAAAQNTASNLPEKMVLALKGDLAGVSASAANESRKNGAAFTASAGVAPGGGNFGNYPIYFGRRGGTSLPFNGHDYGTIIRAGGISAAQLANLESYMNSKTGAY